MIKISFILLTAVMAIVFVAGFNLAASGAMTAEHRKQLIKNLVLFLACWLAYVTFISLSGILQTARLPPRIPLLLILPLFSVMIFFFRTQTFRQLLDAIPQHLLIYPQIFRIAVELLLLAMCREGIVPVAGTFEGYNYEIVIAITALAIGYVAQRKKRSLQVVLIAWNLGGLFTLATVVFIMVSHAYFPEIYSNPEQLSIQKFGAFPYTLLAGFLMPLAVFLHICSLKKLIHQNR